MLDGLFSSKFSNKCKQAVKCIRTRAAPIRKKKQATVSFLRRVVADLLANGLQDDALRRMDDLIAETNHTSCYDMIETFCEFILTQLRILSKQRECSQEVTEAMGTLVFAAARFSDLPELCDLRHIFTSRYGSHIESLANSEFVERFQKKVFSKEKKLQFMQDIANEFSVRWDPVMSAHQQSNPVASKSCQFKNAMPHQNKDKCLPTQANISKENIAFEGRFQVPSEIVPHNQQRLIEPRDTHVTLSAGNSHSQNVKKMVKTVNIESKNTAIPYKKTKSKFNGSYKDEHEGVLPCNWALKVEDEVDPTPKIPDKQGNQVEYWRDMARTYTNKADGATTIEHNAEQIKGHGILSYIKADAITKSDPVKERNMNDLEHDLHRSQVEWLKSPVQEIKHDQLSNGSGRVKNLIPPYVRPRTNKLSVQDDQTNQNFDPAGYDKSNDMRNRCHQNVYTMEDERTKPISVSKCSRLSKLNDDSISIIYDKLSNNQVGRRGHINRQATFAYGDSHSEIMLPNKDWNATAADEVDNDIVYGKLLPQASSDQRRHKDDEVAIDKLLLHYSRKGIIKDGKEKRKSKSTVIKNEVVEEQVNVKSHYDAKELKYPPERAFSLPPRSVDPILSRSNLLHLDLMNQNDRARGHPNAHDYDQLTSHLAALKT